RPRHLERRQEHRATVAALTTVTWIFALLLTAAGAHKLARPASAGAALAVARLPSDHRLVRLLGASEVVLGLAVVLHGGRPAIAALAVTYAAFAIFAERQRRRGAGCGCFAEADTPATGLHVALNAVAALTAAGAAVAPAGPLPAA